MLMSTSGAGMEPVVPHAFGPQERGLESYVVLDRFCFFVNDFNFVVCSPAFSVLGLLSWEFNSFQVLDWS